MSTAIQAALGFAFWIIAARVFNTADVGKASSLISAAALIGFFALLGLNSTFVRFLPTRDNQKSLITGGVTLAATCGAALALFYVLLSPFIAPKLAFIAHSFMLSAGFVLLAAAGAVNLLTDSIFVAGRRAVYNAIIDGGIGGTAKIFACIALAGTGAYGLFCASAGGIAVAAMASLILMNRALGWTPSFQSVRGELAPLIRFSSANYLGNIFNMLPTLIVPLIVLDRIGPSDAGYYFVAFQMVTMVYSGAAAVEQAFLAEGAHNASVSRELRRRSLRIIVAFCIPAWLVFTVASHWIMLAFGPEYGRHSTPCLIVLASAVAPIGIMRWSVTLLRLAGRLRAIIWTNGVYLGSISLAAWLLASRGLTVLCVAWPIGASLGALTAGLATAKGSVVSSGRHRAKHSKPDGPSRVADAPRLQGGSSDLTRATSWRAIAGR